MTVGSVSTHPTHAAHAPRHAQHSPQQARIDRAMEFFTGHGWTRAQAAGIVGNLIAESGVKHDQAQHGGGPGYGLAQWEGPRQASFAKWAGHDIHHSTMQEQLKFIQHELTTTESGAGKALHRADTASEAARVVMTKYERPADQSEGAQRGRAHLADNVFAGSSHSPAPTSPGPRPHPTPSSGHAHTVKVHSGDTLSGIAAHHGVSLHALLKANPQIHNANLIHAGQTIHLPGGSGSGSTHAPASHNYTVRSGDTMSAIATRNHVSLSALAHANPKIHNLDRISIGQTVHIPGAGRSAPSPSHNPSHAGGVKGPAPSAPTHGSSHGGSVAHIARSFAGRNASELRHSSQLPMNPNVSSHVCCANFVSAVLQKAGVLNVHTDLVSGSSRSGRGVTGSIGQILKARGWKVVDGAHARPGDVAIVNNGHHTELVSSNTHGKVTLIGSNNRNADGSQRITYSNPYGNAWYLTPPR